MEKLQCKACGSYSLIPMDVSVEEMDGELGADDEQESRFYTCQVCGDNWLSVKVSEEDGCQITFIHQMGMQPVLKRVAHMDQNVVLSETAVGMWAYFLDDKEVREEEWRRKLDNRRALLKSICSN